MGSNPGDSFDYMFKIIIIGDSGVGKSSILTRYIRNEFSLETKTTIGVELSCSTMNVEDKRIKTSIWDTAGQERFRAATNLYYRNSLGAFIVYDITNLYSFLNVTKWLNELKQYVDGKVVVTLVGNKCDLRHLRAVSKEDAKEFADKNNMNFVETSALDSVNIESSFKQLVHDIYDKIYKYKEEEESNDIRDPNSKISNRNNLSSTQNKSVGFTLSSSGDKAPKRYECCNVN